MAVLLPAASAQQVAAKPFAYDAKSVVRVTCGDEGNDVGTGVRLMDGSIVTARHVVDGGKCHVNGEPATVEFTDEPSDFAILKSGAVTGKARHSCKPFKPGEWYVASGYAEGWEINRVEPWISADLSIEGFNAFVGQAAPGMSGGPLFNRAGQVVGVISMRWPARALALRKTKVCK